MKKLIRMVRIRKLFIISRNRGGLVLPLILLILLFSSCGIAVPVYLNPPVYYSVNLNFYHAYNNDPDYALGYEIFYRIYDDTLINSNTIISEANTFFTETNLLELLGSNQTLIDNSFYRRILPVSNDISTDYHISDIPIPTANIPLMRIDPIYFDNSDSTKKFEINIAIQPTGEGKLTTTNDYAPSGSYASEIDFKRYVTIDGFNFESHTFTEITPDQNDVPVLSDGASSIDIAFFVVLYGITPNLFSIFIYVVYIGSKTNLPFTLQ